MTAHRPTDLLGEIYAQWAIEMGNYPTMSTSLLRIIFDDWQRATAEPEDVTYRHTSVGGVPGIMVRPLDADPQQIQILLHGGGFALGSSTSHRKLAGHIAKACGCLAFVADFRLAPEHPFPAQIEDGVAVYRALLESGYDPADITPVGDSAGANLAIAMTLQLMRAGDPVPSQVITISPWLNMENNGSTIETNNDTDFLIAREGLQANIDRYLGRGHQPDGTTGQSVVRGLHRVSPAVHLRRRRRVTVRRQRPTTGASRASRCRRHLLDRRRHAARLSVPGRATSPCRPGDRGDRPLVPRRPHGQRRLTPPPPTHSHCHPPTEMDEQ